MALNLFTNTVFSGNFKVTAMLISSAGDKIKIQGTILFCHLDVFANRSWDMFWDVGENCVGSKVGVIDEVLFKIWKICKEWSFFILVMMSSWSYFPMWITFMLVIIIFIIWYYLDFSEFYILFHFGDKCLLVVTNMYHKS